MDGGATSDASQEVVAGELRLGLPSLLAAVLLLPAATMLASTKPADIVFSSTQTAAEIRAPTKLRPGEHLA